MSKVNTPGCYGSILSFAPDDDTCQVCRHMNDCGDKAYEQVLEMRDIMDVSELEKKFEVYRVKMGKVVAREKAKAVKVTAAIRSEMTQEQLAIVGDESLPVKPRKLIQTIFRKGFDGEYLLASLKEGINPFRGATPKVLETVFDSLLDVGFTKKELHTTFMAVGMSTRTAHSQVSIAVATLDILGVTEENISSGRIKIKGKQ